jgi:CheY-like chemotaxis protein
VPYTLLLADDSVTIQRVIELTFADQDVTVVAVSDGDQAIERLEAAPPDIVLADIGMPGKSGYEVAQYMRRSPRLAHIPVVLLTGAFEPVDQARASEAGCDGVLAKPFEPQLVIGRVKELLSRSSAARVEAPIAAAPAAAPAASLNWPPAAAVQNRYDAPSGGGPDALNDYFDRLDAAFSNLSSEIPAPPAAPGTPSTPAPASPGAHEVDWFTALSPDGSATTEDWDIPVLPSAAAGRSDPAPASADEALPPAPRARAELPPLADAFAALLAAEAHEGAAASPIWPATLPTAAAVNEQMIEEVTRRVLDRLSDRVLRETVADIVSKVAEQRVREEIERIKAAIK